RRPDAERDDAADRSRPGRHAADAVPAAQSASASVVGAPGVRRSICALRLHVGRGVDPRLVPARAWTHGLGEDLARDGRRSRAMRVVTLLGTRPEVIKLAPVVAELRRDPSI